MSAHKTPRELHGAHEDNRNEAALRLRALASHEQTVRRRTVAKVVGVLVQQPVALDFQPHVEPISPRRPTDRLEAPGGPSSDFPGCCV